MPTNDRLRQLVDRQTPRLRRLLQAALSGLPDGLLEALTVALEAGDIQAALRLVDLTPLREAAKDLLSGVIASSAGVTSARFGMSFTLTDPRAIAAAETQAGALVSGVTEETRQAIGRVIADAIRDGRPPRETARLLMRIVGLTERDAVAVDRLYANLVLELGAEKAEARAGRYAERLLRRRAETIARTEIIRAGTTGRRLGWEAAADQGLLDPQTARLVWIVTQDDRLCPECAPMAGVTVGFADSFTSREEATGPLGQNRGGTTPYEGGTRVRREFVTVDGPPLHPNCRCDISLVFNEAPAAVGESPTSRNDPFAKPDEWDTWSDVEKRQWVERTAAERWPVGEVSERQLVDVIQPKDAIGPNDRVRVAKPGEIPGPDEIRGQQWRLTTTTRPGVFDFSDMDPDAAREAMQQLDSLRALYPASAADIRFVGSATGPGASLFPEPIVSPGAGAGAVATPSSGTLVFNHDTYSSLDGLRRVRYQNWRTELAVTGESSDIARHEFGHFVWTRLNNNRSPEARAFMARFREVAGEPTFTTTWDGQTIAAYAPGLRPVSAYAASDTAEGFSDLFVLMTRRGYTPPSWLPDQQAFMATVEELAALLAKVEGL